MHRFLFSFSYLCFSQREKEEEKERGEKGSEKGQAAARDR